jgi:hypothetical protein
MKRRRVISGVSALALVSASLAACGGGGSASAKSLGEIQSCLSKAGYLVRTTPFGKQLSVAQNGTQIFTVTLHDSEQAAKKQVGDQRAEFGPNGANTGGGAISDGTVVIAYLHPQPARTLGKVKACAF